MIHNSQQDFEFLQPKSLLWTVSWKQKWIKMMMTMNDVFTEWLTGERCLALLQVETTVRDSHHCKTNMLRVGSEPMQNVSSDCVEEN